MIIMLLTNPPFIGLFAQANGAPPGLMYAVTVGAILFISLFAGRLAARARRQGSTGADPARPDGPAP
ncbi:MAG: hypothetical protein ACFB22_01120 [Rhodothalassiaceae bacterium]